MATCRSFAKPAKKPLSARAAKFAPVGSTVPYLPDDAKEKKVDGEKYFIVGDTYYRAFVSGGDTIYMVVDDPTKQA